MNNKMITYLPIFMRKSKVYNEIFNAEEHQFQYIQTDIEDVKKQLDIDTATWGLVIYEKDLKIETDLSKPLDERRSVIKSKERGSGKIDAALIQIVAEAYSNGEVIVNFNGTIIVKFIGTRGVPPNLDDLAAEIENIKPAHLSFEFEFTYLTWNEFDNYNKTWNQWDELNLTWDELETYREVM
ncbi:hypothetical protein SAMN05660297_02737 [Natronincola peptidivorans]|uniref:DUF2313 domain-containing protein n=1 Tax=Natronincola peptidivorans TaxID=426128 RepID=A0A1I0FDL6_9FIRM|nr:YmfQ family protein [Natronincola peptidivorans]SET55294.1 hypothetical protein SAMN05660297_02737 [Natronincola peptidivorans]